MPFQNGHKYGNHNNHHGRLTKEQALQLSGLVPHSINEYRFILAKDTNDLKWHNLKVDVATKILSKFVPELIETDSKIEYIAGSEIAGLLRDVADRVAGKSQDNGSSGGSQSEKGSVQGAD